MKKLIFSSILLFTCFSNSYAINIPAVHPNIVEKNGKLFYKAVPLKAVKTKYSLKQLVGNPIGTNNGIAFDFGKLKGKLYYGFIKFGDGRYPQPVFYKRFSPIKKGHASIDILKNLANKYDMVDWAKTGRGILAYRVVKKNGTILFDGKIAFTGKSPFKINKASIIEGPFVNFSKKGKFSHSVRISFETLKKSTASIRTKKAIFKDSKPTTHHEISLNNLLPNTVYAYTVETRKGNDVYRESYSFKTAPVEGSRKPFIFAYASDSRAALGGGERDIKGANAYIMKKIAALISLKKAAFMQFTGDMINGYSNSIERTQLEYRNWKRAIEPFAHYLPIVSGMGNHEVVTHKFKKHRIAVDRFPFATDSAEAVFARQFVNPTNGPESEDGAEYDPNPNQQDFPSYKENVFYYIYDNVAVVVLNSNYWYAPSLKSHPETGGNLHGYLMDKQLEWLENTLASLDANENIDFIFVSQHTPAFPNGGHVKDDMWYNGNNTPRAVVKHSQYGKNLIQRGIIEQRDEYLKRLINSKKVIALLTGDEHNFNVLKIDDNMTIYPKGWDKDKIKFSRTLYQINNGAAGAPYYAQEKTPWSDNVYSFTTQNAVVFFHIQGKSVKMEVLNPDTLDTILPLSSLNNIN